MRKFSLIAAAGVLSLATMYGQGSGGGSGSGSGGPGAAATCTTAPTSVNAFTLERVLNLNQTLSTITPNIPQTLIDEYEKLRKRLGGVAVAPLVGNACGGCHISMSATELAEIKKRPESAFVHCEECDRLLVRGS